MENKDKKGLSTLRLATAFIGLILMVLSPFMFIFIYSLDDDIEKGLTALYVFLVLGAVIFIFQFFFPLLFKNVDFSKLIKEKKETMKPVKINVGNTPLVELSNLAKHLGFAGKIFAKVESFNPAGSIKDRVALSMINDAENKGTLKAGSTIIEPTSGNTGIGLAYVAKIKGYRLILTMPESMSIERRQLLAKYGAELVLTPAGEGMKGAIAKAKQLNEEIENSIILDQFANPANVKAHYEGTGPEIYRQLHGKFSYFVAGVGTGGTITGCGHYFKEYDPDIKMVAVEPEGSPMLSQGKAGPHKIQGIGAGFIPAILDTKVYDRVITVSNEDAIKYGKLVRNIENISVGISSGAALCAAVQLAMLEENKNKNIVVIFPDGGDRYLSTDLFKD